MPNRLKRQFACFNVPLPSVAAINGIFGKLVEGRFGPDLFSEHVVQVCEIFTTARQHCLKLPQGLQQLTQKLNSSRGCRELSRAVGGH